MPEVESNSVFVTLRAKLIGFYKKYDMYVNQKDLSQFNMSDPPTKEQLDALNQKYVLMRSLKKLLRVAITTFEP